MAAHLLQLRARLFLASFRRGTAGVGGGVITAALLLVTLAALIAGAIAVRALPDPSVQAIVVVIGSFVLTGAIVVPLLIGSDAALDPRKFAIFGVSPWRLANALLGAGMVSAGGVFLLIVGLGVVIAWSTHPGVAILSAFSAALAILSAVAIARTSASFAAQQLVVRRSREMLLVLGVLAVVLLAPALLILAVSETGDPRLGTFGTIAEIVSWTPLGAAWALPGELAAGHIVALVAKALIALLTAGGLVWLWHRTVEYALESRPRREGAPMALGLGWFDLLPASAFGGIAARSMSYWRRDARYWLSAIAIPVIPFLMIVPLALAGVPGATLALIPLPIIALFLGWTLHNDLALDSSALWLHIVSGVSGAADRWGRLVPVLVIGLPVIGLGSVLSAGAHGDWGMLPAIAGVSLAILFATAGVSSVSSARSPYPAAQPGNSPFQQPQMSGAGAVRAQAGSLVAALLLALVPVGLLIVAVLAGGAWPLLLGLVAVAYGLLLLIGLAYLGARSYDERGARLLVIGGTL